MIQYLYIVQGSFRFCCTAAGHFYDADLCEAGGCLDAYGLDGCLGPKHPPAGGCLAEWTAKADFYAAASAASAAASAVCIYDVVIGGRWYVQKYMVKYIQQKQQRQQYKNLLWQCIQISISMPRDAKAKGMLSWMNCQSSFLCCCLCCFCCMYLLRNYRGALRAPV